jgi:hypothetical protein
LTESGQTCHNLRETAVVARGEVEVGDVSLVFAPDRDLWYVDSRGEWYELKQSEDVRVLMSLLPLSIKNTFQLSHVPAAGREAKITRTLPEYVELGLWDTANRLERAEQLNVSDIQMISASWIEGVYRDGWTDLVSTLELWGATALSFDFFLPPRDGNDGKNLSVRLDGKPIASKQISRNAVHTMRFDEIDPENPHTISVECAYPEPLLGTDLRALGVLITHMSLNGRILKPAEIVASRRSR